MIIRTPSQSLFAQLDAHNQSPENSGNRPQIATIKPPRRSGEPSASPISDLTRSRGFNTH